MTQQTTRVKELEGLGLVQAGSLTDVEVGALNELSADEYGQLKTIGGHLRTSQLNAQGLSAVPTASFRPWFI